MIKPLLTALLFTATAHAQTTLSTGDVELSVNFVSSLVGTGTNPWLITMRDGAALKEYAGVRAATADPERVILSAGINGRLEVPDDDHYAFLGAAGSNVWILPEATADPIITPGVSTENRPAAGWQGDGVSPNFLVQGVPGSAFLSSRITLTLASFSGPGNFFLYRTNGFGDPLLSFRTDDGLSAADARNFNAATHTHFNWAFTAPGAYTLGFRASGTLTGSAQLSESDVTTFRVVIVPEPGIPALLLSSLAITTTVRRPRKSRNA